MISGGRGQGAGGRGYSWTTTEERTDGNDVNIYYIMAKEAIVLLNDWTCSQPTVSHTVTTHPQSCSCINPWCTYFQVSTSKMMICKSVLEQ